MRWTADPAAVRPMLATPLADPPDTVLASTRYVFERKYDGMRVLAGVEPGHPTARVTLWSRNGHDKSLQFPEVVRELQRFGASLSAPVLLDGELVALDARGEPTTFVDLGSRLHLRGAGAIAGRAAAVPVALVVFDLLRDGDRDARGLPLSDRKARLEKLLHTQTTERLREAEFSAGDGVRWMARAIAGRWEGLIAKDAGARYESGKRSPTWIKVKVARQQEFVVGGWTEPRESRAKFGSLVIGYYEPAGRALVLRPAGSVGSGFSSADLSRIHKLLTARAIDTCPFDPEPATMEPAHWVRPELIAEVRFTEWTRDQVLRHPVFLGMRTDKSPHDVRREGDASTRLVVTSRAGAVEATSEGPVAAGATPRLAAKASGATARASRNSERSRQGASGAPVQATWPQDPALDAVAEQLHLLEHTRHNGAVALPGGARLDVTNPAKVFWPSLGITKGELLRYYAAVSPALVPIVADRPLVMKRYPNGVTGKSFYQQRAPDDPPAGVRVERIGGHDEPRLVGGSLLTLLYATQLAAISQDPWFCRAHSPESADFAALDLDPMPGVPFAQVRDVARLIRDQLAALDVPACVKTSGSSGIHVYVPLADGTTFEAGQLFCRIVATLVAARHPKLATVERSVGARGRTVYIDYLQNIPGKSLASAYSARANEFAGVSAPLRWEELDEDVHPEDVTVRSALARFAAVGDLWAPMRTGPHADLREALERLMTLVR
jgi:bifunctional non-homologous end joining protein LigD